LGKKAALCRLVVWKIEGYGSKRVQISGLGKSGGREKQPNHKRFLLF